MTVVSFALLKSLHVASVEGGESAVVMVKGS